MLKCVGLFLYIYVHSQNTLMERLPHFTKHYMTETDLVDLLESRGLVISDEAKAIRYLERAYSIGLPPLHKKKAIMTTNKKMSIEDYCTDNGGYQNDGSNSAALRNLQSLL